MKELQQQHQRFLDERPIMKSHPVWATERAGHELDELYTELVDEPTPEQLGAIGGELADVVMFMMNVANHYGLDIEEEVGKKLAFNQKRFPTELFQEGDFLTQYREAKRREGRPVVETVVFNQSVSREQLENSNPNEDAWRP